MPKINRLMFTEIVKREINSGKKCTMKISINGAEIVIGDWNSHPYICILIVHRY